MAASTTLRVKSQTRDRINRLAEEDHLPAGDFIDLLVAKEEHERALRAMNEDFSQLRQDPQAWGAFQAETAAWDATSADAGAAPGEAG
jgi:hypothetical protein